MSSAISQSSPGSRKTICSEPPLAKRVSHPSRHQGGQRALLAEVVPREALGRAYGAQLAIEGIVVLPANVLFGLAYAHLGATTAFAAAGGLALVGAAVLATVRGRERG